MEEEEEVSGFYIGKKRRMFDLSYDLKMLKNE